MLGWGWILICVMFVSNLVQNFTFAIVWVQNIKLGILAKVGFSTSVVKKALRLKTCDDGLVLNMISNDAERLFEMGNFLIWMLSAPMQVATSCSLICVLLGVAGLPCFLIVFVIILVQHQNGGLVGKIRRSAFPFTDKVFFFFSFLVFLIR